MYKYLILSIAIALTSCGNSETSEENESELDTAQTVELDTITGVDPLLNENSDEVIEAESWQNFEDVYSHFTPSKLDTVYIGPNREIKSPFGYFRENRSNQFVIIEEGKYVGQNSIWLEEENLIVEGRGKVSILLDELHDNVMWVSGKNIVINNIHMTHLQPGELEGQNCSGRVIGFDMSENITVANCDLNGCGLAGLHDNLGNGTVYVEHNYIHNNSLGAYTDIDGNIWQEEQDHPVFKFKNNLIEDNGHGLPQDYGGEYYEEDFHGEH